MSDPLKPIVGTLKQEVIETVIALVLLTWIAWWCLKIMGPFLPLVIWGAIIAVAIYPLFQKLRDRFGGRGKLTLGLLLAVFLVVLIAPLWSFTDSTLATVSSIRGQLDAGTLHIPPPRESVADWPAVGDKVYLAWSSASANLSEFMAEHQQQIRDIAERGLKVLAGVGIGALQFLVSVIIALFLMHYAEPIEELMRRLAVRLADSHGPDLLKLSVATVRSVAVGVLGIAAIQAVLAGIGMAVVGVPATGIWTLLVLFVAIAQLPPWLVLIPIIIYVFSAESTMVATLFAIWSMAVSFADMVLKPMFLGRGVDAPMPVILIGAIGGMLAAGIVGLFIGAILLAFGYKLFVAWLSLGETPVTPESPSADGGYT